MRKKLRVFEAFAGIGAQVAALKRTDIDFEVVGISEWFINAILAYDALHCKTQDILVPSKCQQIEYLKQFVFSKDSVNPIKNIESLDSKQIKELYIANKRSKNFGSILNIKGSDLAKLNIDLLTYSFPCQDLSTGGKTLGMKKGSGTRSGLLWEIERILSEMKVAGKLPKYLLLENVKTITSPKNREDLDMWLNFLENIGYKRAHAMTLDASKFGVPQDRKRTIIVSCLDKEIDIEKTLKHYTNYNAYDFARIDYKNTIYKQEADKASLNDTFSRKKMWLINHRELSENTIFHTITCNMDRNNNAGMLPYDKVKNRKYRLLTIREAFLLMGFTEKEYEDVHELGLSYRKENKLIGNSIVVNVLTEVFRVLFSNDYGKN
jgi:DNA (cytosine-5)-methyltransferase 1